MRKLCQTIPFRELCVVSNAFNVVYTLVYNFKMLSDVRGLKLSSHVILTPFN